MSVGFGFSAGDFIAAVELVGTVIDALRESGSASAEYRELLRGLYSLEMALIQVKRLEIHESQHAEFIALRQAAAQCQRTIDNFWNNIKKYQPHLGSSSECSNFRLRTAWTKIKWAVCKREDLTRFKADLVSHTESIQLLLSVIQMQQINLQGKEGNEGRRTLLGRIQDSYNSSMQRLSTIADGISVTISQGKELLQLMAQTTRTNIQVFAIVLDIQNIIKHIPGQIQRQQPVYFVDALGKHSPFHLEFVRSANALIAVLRSNFQKIKQAPEKIDRGEFVIQDIVTRRDIDLTQDWELCFLPGQHVDMSMIFRRFDVDQSSCPSCKWVYQGTGDKEVECPKCGLMFQRILVIEEERSTARGAQGTIGSATRTQTVDEEVVHDCDDILASFRRVRLHVENGARITGTAISDTSSVRSWLSARSVSSNTTISTVSSVNSRDHTKSRRLLLKENGRLVEYRFPTAPAKLEWIRRHRPDLLPPPPSPTAGPVAITQDGPYRTLNENHHPVTNNTANNTTNQ